MSQDYKITNVQPTSFDPDSYGNRFWQIDVDGHDGPLLWKTKSEPEKGSVVFGHTELSKSGKSMLFKKDKKEDGVSYQRTTSSPTQVQQSFPKIDRKDDDIRWAVCLKMAGEYLAKNEPDLTPETWASYVLQFASSLYINYNQKTGTEVKDVVIDDSETEKPLDLSDVPF